MRTPHRWALSVPVYLLLLASQGCVIPPADPGVVEPGAAIRARLDPPREVTVEPDGRWVRVRDLIGRVEAVDSGGYSIRVASAELADGRRARELEGACIHLPGSSGANVTILTADASASHARTFALVGGVAAAVYAFLWLALGGADT